MAWRPSAQARSGPHGEPTYISDTMQYMQNKGIHRVKKGKNIVQTLQVIFARTDSLPHRTTHFAPRLQMGLFVCANDGRQESE